MAVSKNNKEAIVKQSAPSSCIYSNVEIKVEAKSTEKCFAEDFHPMIIYYRFPTIVKESRTNLCHL
ncbi:6154_t:CDS:1, partial [Funneliformis caledonium]